MNQYKDILDAWITIEQLSEGSINKKNRSFQLLYQKQSDWKQFFCIFFKRKKGQIT